ncbi:MAG TPA: hypothetical protein VG755_43300 [Nannocystaceae bacterium]|nr:hypothetical protein [Nannocystaceae bacterium]
MKRSLLVCLLAACAGSGPVADPPDATPPPDPIASTPVPSTPAADTPSPPSSPFAIVATRSGQAPGIGLHLLEDGQLVASAGPLLVQLADDGTASIDLKSMHGIEAPTPPGFAAEMFGLEWMIPVIGGSEQRGLYLVLETSSGFRGDDTPRMLYARSTGQAWRRSELRKPQLDAFPIGFGPYKDGSLLALRAFEPRFDRPANADETWEPSAAATKAVERAIAAQKRLVVIRGKGRAPALPDRDVVAFASLASGEVVAYAAKEGAPVAIHLDAGGARRELPLPAGGSLQVNGIVALAPDHMWMFGGVVENQKERGWLARWDGSAWKEISGPSCTAAISSLAVGKRVHAICELARESTASAVYERDDAGAWSQLHVVGDPQQVAVRGDSDLWLTVNAGDETRLLHRGAAKGEPLALPDTLDLGRYAWEWADAVPMKRGCTFAFLPLTASETRTDDAVLDALSERAQPSYIDVATVRIAGERVRGVRISNTEGTVERSVAKLKRLLGKNAGTPTCNYRPGLQRDGETD